MSLVLATAPAQADKATLHVTATILPRNTCAVDPRRAELRCTGHDAKVLYRVIRESDSGKAYPSAPATALRDQAHRFVVARDGMVTIEF